MLKEKEGDILIRKLRLEQLKQWVKEADKREQELIRIIQESREIATVLYKNVSN